MEVDKHYPEKDKLPALALFTMAHKHYLEMRRFEKALSELLLIPSEKNFYMGHVSDEIYNDGDADFESALKKQRYFFDVPEPPKE